MSCTSPQCYLVPAGGGSPKKLMSDYPAGPCELGRIVYLPCGGCISCRRERRQELTLLQCAEASLHDYNWFLTLTYDDWKTIQLEGLPPYSLCKGHLSRFVESMRHYCRYNGGDFRYFAAGEYGDHFERPHYHLSVFGLSPSLLGIAPPSEDKDLRKRGLNNGQLIRLSSPLVDDNGNEYWRSTVIDTRWPYGTHQIYRANRETFQYVAGYVTKKLSGSPARDFKQSGRILPFQTQSRPSIGRPWFDRFYSSLSVPDREKLINDCCSVGDISWKCPRIFDRWLRSYDHFDGPRVADIAKALRIQDIDPLPDRAVLKRKSDFAEYQSAYYKQTNKHKEII